MTLYQGVAKADVAVGRSTLWSIVSIAWLDFLCYWQYGSVPILLTTLLSRVVDR